MFILLKNCSTRNLSKGMFEISCNFKDYGLSLMVILYSPSCLNLSALHIQILSIEAGLFSFYTGEGCQLKSKV